MAIVKKAAKKTTAKKPVATKRKKPLVDNLHSAIIAERNERVIADTGLAEQINSVGSVISSQQAAITALHTHITADKFSIKSPDVEVASLIHETNHLGQHRIIKVVGNSSEAGEWAHHKEIATLGEYSAATKAFIDMLPEGIFTVNEVKHSSL